MKKLLLSLAILFAFLVPTAVFADARIDEALDNLYQNIEIRTRDNDERARILENMVDKLDRMYYQTNKSEVRELIREMRKSMNAKIREYRDSYDYTDATDIIDNLLGDWRNDDDDDDDDDYVYDDTRVDGADYRKSYEDVEKGDTLKIGGLRVRGESRFDSVDIKMSVDIDEIGEYAFSRVYLKSYAGYIYGSDRSEKKGDTRYYYFENIKAGENYHLYGDIRNLDERRSETEIKIVAVNGGTIDDRSVGEIEFEKKREDSYDPDYNTGGDYTGDAMEISSDYAPKYNYKRAEKYDIIELGRFQTRGGRLGTRSDIELRFETNHPTFRLRDVYIVANGQKVYANNRNTVYANRDIKFEDVLSDSFYTIYGKIDTITEDEFTVLTRFESAAYGELVGTDIFGVAKIVGEVADSYEPSHPNDDYDDDYHNHRNTSLRLSDGIVVSSISSSGIHSNRKVGQIRVDRDTDLILALNYGNRKNYEAISFYFQDNRGNRHYGAKQTITNGKDRYRFYDLQANTDYALYIKVRENRQSDQTILVELDDNTIKHSLRNNLIGKLIVRHDDSYWHY